MLSIDAILFASCKCNLLWACRLEGAVRDPWDTVSEARLCPKGQVLFALTWL